MHLSLLCDFLEHFCLSQETPYPLVAGIPQPYAASRSSALCLHTLLSILDILCEGGTQYVAFGNWILSLSPGMGTA